MAAAGRPRAEPAATDRSGAPEFARPWLKFYGDVPASLDYPPVSLYAAIRSAIEPFPDRLAYEFIGTVGSFRALGEAIDRFAAALDTAGLRQGERVTIALPTSPQGLIAFYATLKLGAVPAMIHPLSAPPEIAHYLNVAGSRFAITLDAFYGKFAEIRRGTPLERLILARIPDFLSPIRRIAFWLRRGRKIASVPADPGVLWWADLMARGGPSPPAADVDTDDLAVILYSGGTTGQPKGVMLSHRNLISEGMEVLAWVNATENDRILAVLPIFHGFGLSGLINAPLMRGAQVVLVPVFSPKAVAAAIRKTRPTIVAGVPTLFDALTKDQSLRSSNLSGIRAAFSGGDTLPRPVKERFEALVGERGGKVRLLEGYGLTEAVTAVIATPLGHYREGSIGIPMPDVDAKICLPGSTDTAAPGQDGEMCIAGPPVMLGYLDDPEASAAVLRRHADGRVWLHTGDLARMDSDGFFSFTGRLKQMIKTSGMAVYPRQVEEALYQHPAVLEAVVIGVPDPALGERVKAVVVLQPGFSGDEAMAAELIAHCQSQLIKWSCPREVVFRADLPKTLVGKIDLKAVKSKEGNGG